MSSAMLMLAAAKPWTYWMSVPLLAACLLAVLAAVIGYYRKVMVPGFEWSLYQAEQQRQAVTPLRQRLRRGQLELYRAA